MQAELGGGFPGQQRVGPGVPEDVRATFVCSLGYCVIFFSGFLFIVFVYSGLGASFLMFEIFNWVETVTRKQTSSLKVGC